MSTTQATHVCHVDCRLIKDPYISGGRMKVRTSHVMYAAEPSSAAGRYQWEQNAAIKRQGRRAWRATGQGQSRECRVWDERRRQAELTSSADLYLRYGVRGRRLNRELAAMGIE